MNLSEKWLCLKNGSDIRGIASEGVQGLHINLTDDVVFSIAAGFAKYAKEKLGKNDITIAIGHDSRISAPRLKECCIDAFLKSGVDVIDCSLSTTPAMFMITVDESYNADASVMLTASHLPFNRNGLKFFTKDGGFEGSDITKILEYAEKNEFDLSKQGSVKKVNYLEKYSSDIAQKIKKDTNSDKPFDGMKIAVDAGNGSGGFYAKMLADLGADTKGSKYLEPDGTFPNHIPNPENKEAMKAISDAVLESKSDLGIIFDTDVDRAAIVDQNGNEINKNRLIALISAVLMEEKKGTIVTDSVTSAELKSFIENTLGGTHHRFRRGYKNVINEAIRLESEGIYAPLAIETSGHAALKENYFLDDGAYLVTRLLIKAVLMKKEGKNLTDLISELKDPQFETGYRLNLLNKDFKPDGEKILENLKTRVESTEGFTLETPNFEGVRVNVENGWFLLRLSLHEPLMPLDIQGNTTEAMNKMISFIKEFLNKFDCIDSSIM